jgi:hypothetical protein
MTIFKLHITGAEGGLVHLTVSGPNHFSFNKSYNRSHDESLDLEPGFYLVSVSASTPGGFTFDVDGYTSISPSVPDSFNNSTHSYRLQV